MVQHLSGRTGAGYHAHHSNVASNALIDSNCTRTRKARVIRRTLEEPISTHCPATILRIHPDATLYLDMESVAEAFEEPSTELK